MNFLKWIFELVTLSRWRARRRRRRYEELKAMIVEEHLDGRGGLVVPRKYDGTDLTSFKPPMYYHARNPKGQRLLFWRKELMSEEVGPPRAPAELK